MPARVAEHNVRKGGEQTSVSSLAAIAVPVLNSQSEDQAALFAPGIERSDLFEKRATPSEWREVIGDGNGHAVDYRARHFDRQSLIAAKEMKKSEEKLKSIRVLLDGL
jgi:hypothetical protein